MALPYSYHTYLFPFIWEGRGKHTVTLSEFKGYFDENPHWFNVDMTNEYHLTSSRQITDDHDAFLFYKEYQYFHPYARKAIYGFADDVVSNYSFKPDDIRNKGHYYIERNGRIYDLRINAIKLKIYNTGVAIFIIEGENHGKSLTGESQENLDAVKAINDFGRRVSLPFIPEDPNGFSCSADSLTLSIDGIGEFKSDFKKCIKETRTKADFENKISLTHFCDFIKSILTYGDKKKISSKVTDDPNRFFIYSALDDRMFVASYIRDKKEITAFRERDNDGVPAYLRDEKLSKSFYELLIVDPPGNCCCQDKFLREEEIKQCTYTRWLDYGSATTCTNQAFITLTDSDDEYLADNFLTQYIQICCLCLAQRASLINFQRQTSAVSAHVEERGRQIRLSTVSELMTLQERFVAFQNQLNFTEVTPQQQGIEMYNMMMERCFIEKEKQSLKEQLDCLCAAANTSLDFNFNKFALIFAVPTLVIDSIGFLLEYGLGVDFGFGISFPHLGTFVLAMLAVVWFLIKYRRRK